MSETAFAASSHPKLDAASGRYQCVAALLLNLAKLVFVGWSVGMLPFVTAT